MQVEFELKMVEREGLEPSVFHMYRIYSPTSSPLENRSLKTMAPWVGFEPTALTLTGSCTTNCAIKESNVLGYPTWDRTRAHGFKGRCSTS